MRRAGMASVQEHYDRHPGRVYGWMLGDFADAACASRRKAAHLADGIQDVPSAQADGIVLTSQL